MFAIKAENLSKVYKKQVEQRSTGLFSFGKKLEDFYALKDISFEIKKGETVGIIGGNGAGKSTLLKILSGITYPTSGRVTVYGRISSLLEVGTGFHPELTGRENIYLNGSLLGMSKAEIKAKFDEIVDFSGIESFIETPVKHYSSGMYVRLAFSVAAHLRTEIILLDEVLAVGDAQFQRKCYDVIKNLNVNGKTVLIVSHDMPAILRHATEGVLLKKGRCIKKGSISEVCNSYIDTELITSFQKQEGVMKKGTVAYENRSIIINVEYSFPNKPIFPNLGIVIYTNHFDPITGSNVAYEFDESNKRKITQEKEGVIEATINDIHLTNGRYILSLWMADGAKHSEHLEYCLNFQVGDSLNSIKGTGPLISNFEFNYK
jgi:lipopolysaccharide transport system ATP-binding protein